MAIAILALLAWWILKGKKSAYANSVCQAAEIDASVEPVGSVATMLPSVAGVAMGSSAYKAKSCSACGM